ncbi:MAG: rRNA maturation RNase YbeY [Lachnospiraceae bacterium]|nr:rRNA maturation RNase YbeY [Lachnospiraceae bacterium]
MTIYLENETEVQFDFDTEETARLVAEKVLEQEQCPYEAVINILLTDDQGIRQFNHDFRDIDRPTDVLSFPNIAYEQPADFEHVEEEAADCFEPDTGELVLGDIIISVDKVKEQSMAYGHSEKREFAFLTAHSMLHLLGYDHMTEEEAATMEEKQEKALKALGITRE